MKNLGFLLVLVVSTFTTVSNAQIVAFSDNFENSSTNWTFIGYSDESLSPCPEDGGLWHVSTKVPTLYAVNGVDYQTVQYGTNHSLHYGYEDHYGLTTYNPAFDPNNIDEENPIWPTLGTSSVGMALSPPIDLTGLTSAELSFDTSEHFDNGYYYDISNGRSVSIFVGGSWAGTVFCRYSLGDPSWQPVTYDLSAFCGQVIQVEMDLEVFPPVWDPSANGDLYFPEEYRDRGDGWYIDNLLVTGTPQ